MFAKKILVEQLELRIDADFYQPIFIDAIKRIRLHRCKRLNELTKFIRKGIFDMPANLYSEQGVPFLRISDFEGLSVNVETAIKIPHWKHEEECKTILFPGDLVLSKVGTTGQVAKIPEGAEVNISQNLVGISVDHQQIDCDYLLAALNSPTMFLCIDRHVTTAVQGKLTLDILRSLEVPIFNSFAQKYIGDKVRQAEQMRAWAKRLEFDISTQFAFLVETPLPARTSWRATKENLDSYRINPKQYDPVVLDLLNRAKLNGVRLQPLRDLLSERQIAGGATPKGAQYYDKGVLFARVQNVKPLRLELSDAVFVDQAADEELARSRCVAGDIILTITGYPGTASLVTEEDLPVNINQHSVRFGIKENIGNGFVCAALNSRFLKYQVDRLAIGGTRDALDYPSVGRLLIPRLASVIEQEIDKNVRNVVAAKKLAQCLTATAKLLVEALIEGQIDESLLIAAQDQLQSGNDSLDRSILARLKTDGLDGSGSPLFADLDQLYNLLAQAESVVDHGE